jgi:hypothetical protein
LLTGGKELQQDAILAAEIIAKIQELTPAQISFLK